MEKTDTILTAQKPFFFFFFVNVMGSDVAFFIIKTIFLTISFRINNDK